jgi:flagellin-specific chaperone FliS
MQSNSELEARIDKLEKIVDELTAHLTRQAGHNLTNSLAITKLARHAGLMPEDVLSEPAN